VIVVDASALIAFFFREEGWENLAKYMARTVSVDLAIKEFYNALWKAVYLQRRISASEAKEIISLLKTYIEKNMELRDETDYMDKAFEIALSRGITVYDALYVALAVEENIPLLTLDKKQRAVAQACGVLILP